jgi:hypothetical protein
MNHFLEVLQMLEELETFGTVREVQRMRCLEHLREILFGNSGARGEGFIICLSLRA